MDYHRRQRQFASAQRAWDNMTPPDDPPCLWDRGYDCCDGQLMRDERCWECEIFDAVMHNAPEWMQDRYEEDQDDES